MSPTNPSPTTWTLRFKNYKSTTVLHVDPLQSLDSIKEELLSALRQTHPDGRLNGEDIPEEASQITLGRPNDVHNLDKGWTRVVDREGNIITGNEPASKKRKGDEGELKLKEQSPKAAGWKDGLVLAYKLAPAEEGDSDDETWDVVLPSYDEASEG